MKRRRSGPSGGGAGDRLLTLALLGGLTATLLPAAPAGAEAYHDNCFSVAPGAVTTEVKYRLTGSDWNSTDGYSIGGGPSLTFAQQFELAISEWEQVVGPTGVPLIDFEVVGSGGTEVQWVSYQGDAQPLADVPDGCWIRFNTNRLTTNEGDYLDLPGLFHAVARHEVGHTLGLNHSGFADSISDGLPPTMGSCYGDIAGESATIVDAVISHDDRAALNQRYAPSSHTSWWIEGRWASSNTGFEEEYILDDWETAGVSFGIGPGRTGDTHVRLSPTGVDLRKWFQRVSVAFANQQGSPEESIHAFGVGWFRAEGAPGATVTTRVLATPVTYEDYGQGTDDCDFPVAAFQNVRTELGPGTVLTERQVEVGTDWREIGHHPFDLDNLEGAGAYDLVYGVYLESGSATVELDDAGILVGEQFAQ